MFADIQTAIVDRLKAKLDPQIAVITVADVERARDLAQKAPAVFVVYAGYTPLQEQRNGAVQLVQMHWGVVCNAASARGQGDPLTAQEEASTNAEAVLRALIGFHVGKGRYVHLEAAPSLEFDGGYCWFPLAFTVSETFRSSDLT